MQMYHKQVNTPNPVDVVAMVLNRNRHAVSGFKVWSPSYVLKSPWMQAEL